MKKLLTAMIGVSLLACLLLTACGGDKPAAGNSGDSSTSTSAGSSEPGNTDDQDDGGVNYAQEIVDASQDQLASLQQEGMTIELLARDPNTLVYLYTLSDGMELPANVDELLEQQSSIFSTIASQMEQLGAKNAKVIIEYVNEAGEILFTKTFEKA